MINEFLYKPLEKKVITKYNRFKIKNKDLKELKSIFKNKIILISGAAGSIGSQFSKDILTFNLKPKKIILLDKDENQLTELNRDLLMFKNFNRINIEFICLDLTLMNLDNFLLSKSIQLYLNFSALKHVRAEENIESTKYMFKTNSISFIPKKRNKLKKIFSISTDKTVNPSSILGISKYLMEMNLNRFANKKVIISSVRFANVAFSNGSILKYVADRIIQKKKFGIPDKVRRYFITHEEASSLCFKSLLKRNDKKITIPNPKILNKDHLVVNLVKKIIREFNYIPKFYKNKKRKIKQNYNNNICNILLTPLSGGQKTYEEFVAEEENIQEDLDRTICTVEFPKYNKNIEKIISKIMKCKNIKQLKIYLIKNFKNYNPPKKFINISKTI